MIPATDPQAEAFAIFDNGGTPKDAIDRLGLPRSTAYKYQADWKKERRKNPPPLELIDGSGTDSIADLRWIKRELRRRIAQSDDEDPRAIAQLANSYLKAIQIEGELASPSEREPMADDERISKIQELLAKAKSRRSP